MSDNVTYEMESCLEYERTPFFILMPFGPVMGTPFRNIYSGTTSVSIIESLIMLVSWCLTNPPCCKEIVGGAGFKTGT